jgi:hypothetical protein
VNTERILELADVIERTPHKPLPSQSAPARKLRGFNMGEWHCGTVGCMAGWAGQMFDCHPSDAADALGLTRETAWRLFQPIESIDRWEQIKPKQAAAVLRNLAETGEVDWSIEATP